MTIEFFFKGLSVEDRLFPHTVGRSAELAKGTLYEAWFDTLKISPWYRKISLSGKYPSEKAKLTWDSFGDLTEINFDAWWKKRGYKIFSESVPFMPMKIDNLSIHIEESKNIKKPPTLKIEVPLNLSPAELKYQFNQILRNHEVYAEDYDRWDHSTAQVHQYRESKLSYGTIKKWLYVFEEFERRKHHKEFKLYNLARDLELHSTLFKGLTKSRVIPTDLRVQASNVVSDVLKLGRNVMANATEMKFPCTDPHQWATSRKSSKAEEPDWFDLDSD